MISYHLWRSLVLTTVLLSSYSEAIYAEKAEPEQLAEQAVNQPQAVEQQLIEQQSDQLPTVEQQLIEQQSDQLPAVEQQLIEQQSDQLPTVEQQLIEQQSDQLPTVEQQLIEQQSDQLPAVEQQAFNILGGSIEPGETAKLEWTSGQSLAGRPVKSPVTVVHGKRPGPVLCLVAAIHGDELNGVEIVRRIGETLDPETTSGTVITVPIVNVYGLTSNSRYLPDRRDLNRFFPGNPTGSSASRIAYSFFTKVISYCNYVVDFHTGSFMRINLPQLRADMNNPAVIDFVQHFGSIVVLHKTGHDKTLRSAATNYGIPAVTFELGQPGSIQEEYAEFGLRTINYLLQNLDMVESVKLEIEPQPIFLKSRWVRANSGGILFSKRKLGEQVRAGDLLGTLINPVNNYRIDLLSPVAGRVLGMALNQFMLPGYAAFHVGITTDTESMVKDEPVATDDYGEQQEEYD